MLQNKKYGPDWELIWSRKFHRDLYRLNMTGRGYTDKNFGLDVIIIREGKGKKDRSVMFDIELKRELKIYYDIDKCTEYVFEGYKPGVPLSGRTIEKIYENACKKAGIRSVGGIHTLRYSFETHLLENGVDLRYIQELSGLSRSTTTEIYTHVSSNKIGKIRIPLAYLREKSGRVWNKRTVQIVRTFFRTTGSWLQFGHPKTEERREEECKKTK